MPKYEVNVRETVWYFYVVEADTEEAADEKAKNIWVTMVKKPLIMVNG